MKRNACVLTIVVFACLAAGCAKLTLKHTPLASSAQAAAPVALIVKDLRAEEFGGGNDLYIGRQRNLYGMPIKFESQNSMTGALTALFTDALRAAGYQVVAGSPTQVEVDVKMFFMDGYMGYKIDSAFDVRVVSGGAVVFQAPIAEGHGFGYMKNADLYAAFDHLMDKVAGSAVAVFGGEQFKVAAAPK